MREGGRERDHVIMSVSVHLAKFDVIASSRLWWGEVKWGEIWDEHNLSEKQFSNYMCEEDGSHMSNYFGLNHS